MKVARRASWLSLLFVGLLVVCTALLLRELLDTFQVPPQNGFVDDLTEADEVIYFSLEEGLAVVSNPESSIRERSQVGDSILREGNRAVPVLKSLLDHPSYEVRSQAIVLLGRIGPAAIDAGPQLLALADTAGSPYREKALYAAWMVHAENREAVRVVLQRGLRSELPTIALICLNYLAELKPLPVDDLLWAAEVRTNQMLSAKAAELLVQQAESDQSLLERLLIQPRFAMPLELASHRLRPALARIVRSEREEALRFAALLTLVSARDPARPIEYDDQIPWEWRTELEQASHRHRDDPRAIRLPRVLSRGLHQDALPILKTLLESTVIEVRCSAAFQTVVLDETAIDMLPHFRDALRAPAANAYEAVWGLERLGELGREAIPELVALRNQTQLDWHPEVRRLLMKWNVPESGTNPSTP